MSSARRGEGRCVLYTNHRHRPYMHSSHATNYESMSAYNMLVIVS